MGEIHLTTLTQIKVFPVLTKDQKIIVPIPAIVENLITVSLYKTESEKITKPDGDFSVLLKDSMGNIVKKSQINSRSEAYFSSIPSKEYSLIVFKNGVADASWQEKNTAITGQENMFKMTKINNSQITTHGKIFTDNKFLSLVFDQQISQIEKTEKREKLNDVSILMQYTERLYSGQTAKIDVKIFDINQNKLNNFNQNYGYVPNTNIKITVLDRNEQIFSSSDGITNERGFYNTGFFIPKNIQNGAFTVIINAENDNSESSKTIQIFNLGEVPDHDSP